MSSILPSNSTPLEIELETTASRVLPNLINTVWNPATCPAEFLDYLAWGLAVIEWESSWSEAVKRQVILDSISVYQYLGTPGALKLALASIGFSSIKIIEFPGVFIDGSVLLNGKITLNGAPIPYQFDVILNVFGTIPSAGLILKIKQYINTYKNARSHLRNLFYESHFLDGSLTLDGSITLDGGLILG